MNLYEQVTSTILSSLKRGVIPWQKPWSTTASIPVNAFSNRQYRGVNVLLLGLAPYSDHRWLTYKQVNEKGGSVRKGEKSTMVVFWKFPEPKNATDQEKEEARKQVPLLRYYSVFNAEQCEGLELPEVYKPTESPNQRIARADLLVRSMPDPPLITEAGSAAWYRPVDDLVNIPPLNRFTSADSFYATLFHELGHATGHEKRLKRTGVIGEIRFGSGEYSREELVAELTSAFCCATVGLDNQLIEDSASYIEGWLDVLKADPKAVVIAAAQAQRAADHIRGITYQ